MDRRKLSALFIVTLFVLAGCTRSEPVRESASDQPVVTPSTQPDIPADTRPVIVAFGDSLSEGFGAEPGKSFPDFLQQNLDRAGYRYRIVNMGISGDTTSGGLGRVDSVIGAKPEVVLVELGGNDGLRGIPVAATKQNLARIIEQLQAARVTVVLAGMTLPPNYGSDYVRSFEKVYRDLAAQYRVTLIPFLFEDIVKSLAQHPGLMQRDGIHPTAAGNRLMAETVFRYMKPALRRG
jgi:acyl-CoA thioesterase-1